MLTVHVGNSDLVTSDYWEVSDGDSPIEVSIGDAPNEVGDGDSPIGVGDGDSPTGVGDGDSPIEVGDGDSPLEVGDGDSPIEVGDGDYFSAHVVVESVDAVCVDETVADPAARLHRLLDLADHVKRFVDPVLTAERTARLCRRPRLLHRGCGVLQNIVWVVCGDTKQLTLLVPVNLRKKRITIWGSERLA